MGCSRVYLLEFNKNGFIGIILGDLFELGLQNKYFSWNILTDIITQVGSPNLYQFLE